MGKLSALSVKAAKTAGRYQDGRGLMLLVKPSGARSWILRMQVAGRRRDFGLGSLHDVSLAEAREKAMETRKLYRSGVDPVAEKKAALLKLRGIPTFAEAARTVFDEQKSSWKNAKHRSQWISSLEKYANPTIGDTRIDEITGPMIREVLILIWLEKPETARRVRQRIGTVLDWAHAKGYRDAEAPMRLISKGLPKQPKQDNHYAAMPYADIPQFLDGLLSKEPSMGRLALRFVIFTAARSGEVRGATWEEIDLEAKTWTIPGERMKAGREHIVPLSQAALGVLSEAEALRTGRAGEPIFPGIRGKPMSDMTLAKVLKTAGVVGATVHGFRSAFRDWAAEMTGTQGDVVEAALAHVNRNRVEAAYRRTNYLEKRRSLMQAWASYLLDMGSGVIPIKVGGSL